MKHPQRKKLTKVKRVDSFVSKALARKLHGLLTRNHPGLSALFTELLTLQSEENATLKTIAARDRLEKCITDITLCTKYGWSFGINAQNLPEHPRKISHVSRRITTLIEPAIEAGHRIGTQLRIEAEARKHHINQPGVSHAAGQQVAS